MFNKRSIRKEALPELSLVTMQVAEGLYKVDLELHDRYRTFANELLRLALAELGGMGFLLANVGAVKDSVVASAFRSSIVPGLGVVAVLSLGVTVAASMAHCFFASDCLYHHIRAIKLLILDKAGNEARALEEENARNEKFDLAETALYLAAGTLLCGTAAIGLGVIVSLAPALTHR